MKSNSFSQGNPRAWRNPWVIGWITLIVIVLSVNAFMISMAYITNPGLVSKDYYERGRDHEKNIDKKLAARKALGWTINTQFPDEPVMQRSERYRFSTVDSKGLPLNGATVFLHAYRPADSTQDFKLSMGETTPGFYEANVNFPLKGLWVLTIHLQKGDDVYNFTKRISVQTQ